MDELQLLKDAESGGQTLESWVVHKCSEWRDSLEANYFEKWDEYYRIWRGIWSENDKTRDSERSKLISPATQQAVMSPLTDMQRRRGNVFPIHDLTHGNQKKNDRIAWALQGRFQNGMVYLRAGAPWLTDFLDELYQFPDKLTHDDMIDALAYVDQLSDQSYLQNYEIEDFEIFDDVSGW